MTKLPHGVCLLVLPVLVCLNVKSTNGQVPPSPNLMVPPSSLATSISLTWDQPQGTEVIEGYEITYSYQIKECIIEGTTLPTQTFEVILNNGSLRSYTITNSPDTPVEEDSDYTITITAVDSVGRSSQSSNVTTTTAQAAPGAPQSLRAASVNVTAMTIQWDRANCQNRNGPTDGYRFVYFPTPDRNMLNAEIVTGTGNSDRILSVTGLSPRTDYTIEVQTSNALLDRRGTAVTITVTTSVPQNFGFLLAGQLYPNNSIVTLSDIGNRFSGPALYCLTLSTECCSNGETPNEATVIREWYLPDGTQLSSGGTTFSREQVSSAVSLYRNGGTSLTGVFRCEVPDASGNSQSIYVGIYPLSDGSPSIRSVIFDRNTTTLTCTSTGGPPTTVTWRKNGVLVNDSLYQQSQRVVDAVNAAYESVLFNADVTNFVGTFTCEVSNSRDTAEETVELNGVSIIRDQFTVGQSATARCFSDVPATRMEWLTNGVVVESAASTQQLNLVFSPVNDSIHNQPYICRVTREVDGMTVQQNFTVNVDVPPEVVTANVSRSGTVRAGMVYNLTCTVSKTVSGLANSPTAMWTIRDVPVSTGNGIIVSGSAGDRSAISTLTFEPLTTSHQDGYSCVGTLTSPALDMPLTPSTVEPLRVQISTPDITITVPPGPLYAGRTTPLTLTCNISLNSATDTPVSVTDMDITWLNGSSLLSDSDARVTISSPSGSQHPFTSILTLSPLSTFDSTSFTCRARARPPAGTQTFVTASELGERTVSRIIVDSPLPPAISIVHSNVSVMAGEPLTLTCSASLQEGIAGSPTLMWTRGGVEQSNEATLTFDPLLTSHGGVYTCTARLTIPEAGVDVAGTDMTNVVVQVPPPLLTISGSPRNTRFFLGLHVTFTCNITLNTAVDTPVIVQGIWNRNGTELNNGTDSGRITVSNPPMKQPPYQTTVRFSPLNNITDPGTYECTATVTPQNDTFITGTTSSISRTIYVTGFPTQEVNPITDEGISTAGFSGYTLKCITTKEPLLYPTTTLAVQWLDPSGIVIVNGTNFTISGSGPTMDTVLTSRLIFNNLYTSQGGEYTCRTLQTIPGVVSNHPEPVTFTVFVKFPPPLISIIGHSTPYNGTNFTLTGVVMLDPSVDTDVIVSGVWSSDDTPQETMSPPYPTSLTFRPLATNSSGDYTLTVTVQPLDESMFIVRNNGSRSYSLTVAALPSHPPTIKVASRHPSPEDGCGETMILNCTANPVENLFVPPVITWRYPNGEEVPIAEDSNPRIDPETRQLIFTDITSGNQGRYTCQAVLNIPQAQIVNHVDMDTVQVNTNFPGVVQDLICVKGFSPTELSFSWELPTVLGNKIVGYQVEVKGLRHRSGPREVVQFDVAGFNTDLKAATISQGLAGEVPYNITVKAVNLAGCGQEQQIYCFSQEGEPPPPANVVVVRFDSTSIGVSWTKFTLVELKGLANYVVTYNIIIGSRKRQLGGILTVPWTQNRIIISNLQPGAEYDVTVSTSTAAGTSVTNTAPVGPAGGHSIVTMTTSRPPSPDSFNNTTAIVGGVVAIVLIIVTVTAVTILVIVALVLRNRKAIFKPSQRREKESDGTGEVDHEYEILDKYSQAYDDVKSPDNSITMKDKLSPSQSGGDFELIQCPAYIPVGTAGVQSSESKS